jgi:hypothetical protein
VGEIKFYDGEERTEAGLENVVSDTASVPSKEASL